LHIKCGSVGNANAKRIAFGSIVLAFDLNDVAVAPRLKKAITNSFLKVHVMLQHEAQ
jgi:hypothetical protein